MAGVVFDSASSAHATSWSHTIGSGSDRILMVTAANWTVFDLLGITFNGVPLTKLASSPSGFNGIFWCDVWYLVNPPVGTFTIALQNTGQATGVLCGAAISFFGVHQTIPIDNYQITQQGENEGQVPCPAPVTPTLDRSYLVAFADLTGDSNVVTNPDAPWTERAESPTTFGDIKSWIATFGMKTPAAATTCTVRNNLTPAFGSGPWYTITAVIVVALKESVFSWTPAELATPAWMWLDAGKETFSDSGFATPQTTDQGIVNSWKDQSGNGRHLIQANSGFTDNILQKGANGLGPNLMPAVTIGLGGTGANGLIHQNAQTLTVPCHIYLVGIVRNTGGLQVCYHWWGTTGLGYFLVTSQGTLFSGNNTVSTGGPGTFKLFRIQLAQSNGGSWKVFTTDLTSTHTFAVADGTNILAGGAGKMQFLNAGPNPRQWDICEIIVIQGTPTALEDAYIYNYLNIKYNLGTFPNTNASSGETLGFTEGVKAAAGIKVQETIAVSEARALGLTTNIVESIAITDAQGQPTGKNGIRKKRSFRVSR